MIPKITFCQLVRKFYKHPRHYRHNLWLLASFGIFSVGAVHELQRGNQIQAFIDCLMGAAMLLLFYWGVWQTAQNRLSRLHSLILLRDMRRTLKALQQRTRGE
jgi:hypothetical protein